MVDGLKLGLFFPFSHSLSSCEPHLDVLLITLSLAEANLVEKKIIFSFSRFPLFSTKGKKENEIKWVVFILVFLQNGGILKDEKPFK